MVTEASVRKALEGVMDPELHRSLIELGMVREVRIIEGSVGVTLALTTLGCPLKDQIVGDVENAVEVLEGVREVEVDLTEMTDEEKRRIGIGVPQQEKGAAEDLNEIHRVIAVMSGKGGVGKSLVSGLLAVALRAEGHRVGILDADITGPSIPKMFFPDGARLGMSPMGPMPPQSRGGVKVMSINLLLEEEDQAVIWRGPSVGGAMGKLFVQALALDPTGDRVFAGTHVGVYESTDGGQTWRWATEDLGAVAVFAMVVDPHDADRIYAGSWGHNILRSTDGGGTWAPVHHGLETLSVHALAVDPADAHLLYAGTVEAVYRSTDGGKTWHAYPFTDRPLTTFALLIDAAMQQVVLAGTTEGIYRSKDRGQTWQPIGHDSLDATVASLVPSPTQPGARYAGTEHRGLFRSTDGGEHWQPWGLQDTSVYAILADSAGTLWLGTDQGVFRSP